MPSDIVAVVVRTGQAFVAQKWLTVQTKSVPAYRTALRRALGDALAALKSYDAANLNDQKSFGLHEKIEDQLDRGPDRCFAAHLRKQPHWNSIVAKLAKSSIGIRRAAYEAVTP